MRRIIECTLAIVLLAGCTNGQQATYSKPAQQYVSIDSAYTRSILKDIQDRSFGSLSGFKSLQQLAKEADWDDDGNCNSIEASRLQQKYQRNPFQ